MADIRSLMNPEDTPVYTTSETTVNVSAVYPTTNTTITTTTDSVTPPEPQPESSSTTSASADNGGSNEVGVLTPETIMRSFERIKTHFPAARIKKIMQSDDEIGKIAQATPVVVGRALEIFMANLVELAMLEARKQRVKRVGASHIRAAIEKNEQFDFLVDVVSKYPPLKE